jgi:hypothetical protein
MLFPAEESHRREQWNYLREPETATFVNRSERLNNAASFINLM